MDSGYQQKNDRDSVETAIMLLSAAAVGTYMVSRFCGIDPVLVRRRGALALRLGVYRTRTLDLSRYGMRVWWDDPPLEDSQFEIDVDTIAVGGPSAYRRLFESAGAESQTESHRHRSGAGKTGRSP